MKDKWKKILIVVAVLLTMGVLAGLVFNSVTIKSGSMAKFEKLVEQHKIKSVVVEENLGRITYETKDARYRTAILRNYFEVNKDVLTQLNEDKAKVVVKAGQSALATAQSLFSMLLVIALLLYFGKFLGGMAKVKLDYITDEKARFTDVGGMENVKKELKTLVAYMKSPEGLKSYVDKIPKGILFEGDPGNGKTLLARVLAGESNTPFFYISAADIEGSFVGQGASRVGTIFKDVKEAAAKHGKAILFLDELDAIGMNRSKRSVSETNQTLNKVLTELDGFTPNDNILVIGATNLAESLDPALVRSGRFDRVIKIPSPSKKDRKLILELYLEKKRDKVEPVVWEIDYLEVLANQTQGFSSADLARLVNDALLMAFEDKSLVTILHLRESFLRVVMGLPSDESIHPEDDRIVAYHEAAHAVIGMATSSLGARSVAYGTIKPYGQAAGHVSYVDESRMLMSKKMFENRVYCLLAGRAIEDLLLDGDFTSGASNDLMKVNQWLHRYVTEFGMSNTKKNFYADANFGDAKADWIQDDVQALRETFYENTMELVKAHRGDIDLLAEYLLTHREIDQDEILELFGDKYPSKSMDAVKVETSVEEPVVAIHDEKL